MLSVAATGTLVERLCRQVGGNVFAANYNAPDQTVVGGDEESISRLEAQLKADKVPYRRLAVPRPFHTPLMADTQAPLAAGLAPIAMTAPRVPVLSTVTNRLVASPDEMRANLVAQMTSPVRYVDLIGQLADLGVRALVEVGPHQVLTGLHQKILADRDLVSMACDDKNRGGLARLLAVQACLDAQGLLEKPAATVAVEPLAATGQVHDKHLRDGQVRDRPTLAAAAPHTNGHPAANNGHAVPVASSRHKLSVAVGAADQVLVLSGSPYEIGLAHGKALAENIRSIARRMPTLRASRAMRPARPTLLGSSRPETTIGRLSSSKSCADWPRAPAFPPRCSAFTTLGGIAVWPTRPCSWSRCQRPQAPSSYTPSRSAPPIGILGVTWIGRRTWRVYRPTGGLAHAVVAWPGMLGGSAGINEHGLTVTSAGPDVDSTDGQITALRSLLVRRVLQQAGDVDRAIALLRAEAGSVSGDFCISHPLSPTVNLVRLSAGAAEPVVSCRAIARRYRFTGRRCGACGR